MPRVIYNKEILIDQIKDYVKKNNEAPTARKMREQGYAGIHSFINHFGSFKNALIESGAFDLRGDKHQFYEKTYSEEEMLNALRDYMKDKDRIPTNETMKRDLKPSVSTYNKRFGSVHKALSLIGYDYDKQKENDNISLEKDMIEKYISLARNLGRVPTSRDIENNSRNNKNIYAMKTYEAHFGSLHNLQVKCGFISTGLSRHKTTDELIDDLKTLAITLNRNPHRNDLIGLEGIAGEGKYKLTFGSWSNALRAAGLKPGNKVHKTKQGNTCLSYYEFLFTSMLEKYSYEFTKEAYYKDFIPTDRKYRFDFIVNIGNKKHFVEIFGITSNQFYSERAQTKINLCKQNSINIIEIYPDDFKKRKLEDIHQMFISKI